jgi:hypothetical protein
MTQPVIAVDIDGILAEFNEAFLGECVKVIEANGDDILPRDYLPWDLPDNLKSDCTRWIYNYKNDHRRDTDAHPSFYNFILEQFHNGWCRKWEGDLYAPNLWDWPKEFFGRHIPAAAYALVDQPDSTFWLDRQPLQPWVDFFKSLQSSYALVFVTSRRGTPACRKQTVQWLEQQGFVDPTVIFSRDGFKGWAVAALGAVAFIDDHYKNCVDVLRANGTKCKVFVKDWQYNRQGVNSYVNETPYIHRVFQIADFTAVMKIDPNLIPEGASTYGREARRQYKGTTSPHAAGSLRRSGESLYEWGDEVRGEQLERRDGLDQIFGRSGEAPRAMARGGGSGSGQSSPPPSPRNSESFNAPTIYPVESGEGRSSAGNRVQPVRELTGNYIPIPTGWYAATPGDYLVFNDITATPTIIPPPTTTD